MESAAAKEVGAVPRTRGRMDDAEPPRTLMLSFETELATSNVKDFEGLGFARLWNPLLGSQHPNS